MLLDHNLPQQFVLTFEGVDFRTLVLLGVKLFPRLSVLGLDLCMVLMQVLENQRHLPAVSNLLLSVLISSLVGHFAVQSCFSGGTQLIQTLAAIFHGVELLLHFRVLLLFLLSIGHR